MPTPGRPPTALPAADRSAGTVAEALLTESCAGGRSDHGVFETVTPWGSDHENEIS